MAALLPYVQIVLSILLIIVVLLQQNEAGMGSAFGGGDSSVQYTRRGFEKGIFYATIVLAILFGISALLALII